MSNNFDKLKDKTFKEWLENRCKKERKTYMGGFEPVKIAVMQTLEDVLEHYYIYLQNEINKMNENRM